MRHLLNSFRKRANRDFFLRARAHRKGACGFGPEGCLYRRLQEVSRQSDSTGSGRNEYWQIYSSVRDLKPTWVLECGAGVSTVVIAHALMRNARAGHPGRLVSMEENPHYYQQLLGLLNAEEKEVVDLVLSGVVEKSYGSRRSRSYKDRPPHPFNLVFVDGPVIPHESGWFNADYLEVVMKSPAKVVALMEGRRFTRAALGEYLARAGSWDMRHPLPRLKVSQEDVDPLLVL
jgi:hypothetical protein